MSSTVLFCKRQQPLIEKGLVHISEISASRVEHVTDVVVEGGIVWVKVVSLGVSCVFQATIQLLLWCLSSVLG